jgi:glycine/D-amino acid oxidase-like deaminating enzyme
MAYLWKRGVGMPRFPALGGNVSTDVLVIGGGMAGVLCARLLRGAGVDCLLAEATQLGRGVTAGTTAVLTAQHDTLYSDLIKTFGKEKARNYLTANLRAVEEFRALSEKNRLRF